jgi:hypothetical protein
MNLTRKAQRLLLCGIAPLMFGLSAPLATLAATPPVEASQHGYNTNTFSSNFTAQTVDVNRTLNRGYKWYLFDFFSKLASPAGITINGDGTMTLLGDSTGAIGELSSIAPYRGTNTFVGTAFGGGLYIEAVFHYDPAQVTAAHAGGKRWPYPSFWSLPIEGNGNLLPGGNQWPGQAAGYIHNVEVDFFEADYVTKPTAYGVGLHDWYGIQNVTCPSGLCVVHMLNPTGERDPPAGTDFNQFHTYGFLWVPATATTQGYMSAYFDGVLVGHTVYWSQYTNQAPTPVGQPWCFGRIDQQHLYFILGTGVGEQYTLKSVNVWQKDASHNLTNNQ